MKVVIAGSRALPGGQAPRLLITFLAGVPEDTIILLRHGLSTEAGRFEQDVQRLCDLLRLGYEWCYPAPDAKTPGRGSVYLRDIDMVERSDLVLLFFTPDEAVEGYSGTAHLMDKALDAARPVYAYTVGPRVVERVGEYDPDDLFSTMVPVP